MKCVNFEYQSSCPAGAMHFVLDLFRCLVISSRFVPSLAASPRDATAPVDSLKPQKHEWPTSGLLQSKPPESFHFISFISLLATNVKRKRIRCHNCIKYLVKSSHL